MKTTKSFFLLVACLCFSFGANAAYNGTPVTPNQITSENYSSYGFNVKNYTAYEGWYAISTAEELYGFAALVNNSNSEKDVFNCVLTADIVVNENVLTAAGVLNGTPTHSWTPIGRPSTRQSFSGKFDGQGHTISGLYYSGSNSSIGLFGSSGFIYDENGSQLLSEISNVGVIDSYFNGRDVVGGICAGCKQSIISNCYNTGVVIGSSYVGGISGIGGNGEYYNDFGFIVNCYNTGIVKGRGKYVGGVCGTSTYTYNTYYLANCAKDGSGKIQNGIGNDTAGQTTDDVSGSTMSATAEEFASGKIAFLLNGKVSGGTTWYQNLNSDPLPVLERSHSKVYASQPCPISFANCEVETEEHDLIDGICSKCGGYETPALVDGWYLIDNASKLYWFADAVNSSNTTICGKLTADIIVNENVLKIDGSLNGTPTHSWVPIGTVGTPFAGKFDGQGHTISGLYFYRGPAIYRYGMGLFGYARGISSNSLAEISNVGVVDSFLGGSNVAGGICGGCWLTTITNCYNTGTVMGEYEYVGGICGGCDSKITNCYNTGKVGGKNAICGYGSARIVNCYYLDGCFGGNSSSNGRKATAEEFASGKIAYLLNGSVSEGDLVWYQTLFSDAAPVLDPTHNRVTGYVDEADNVITVYGDVMIASEYEIAEGKTFVVPSSASVTIAEGVELINNGTITCSGALVVNGTVSGNEIGGSGNFIYTNLSENDVETAPNGYTYKGTEYTLENGLSGIVRSRTICGKLFTFDATGYTVSYENNLNVGDNAKIIWTGSSTIEKTFAITPNTNVTVTITGNSNTVTYNTEEQNVSGYTVGIEDETGVYAENDIAFSGTAAASGTTVGTYAMGLSTDNFSNTNTNFADVQFVVTDGELTISKAENAPSMPSAIETYYINTERVSLPEHWQWVEDVDLEKGDNTATAEYVGTDADNYVNVRAEVAITRTACPHNEGYITINKTEPTCTQDGYTGDHKCNICNEIFEQGEPVSAIGHKADSIVLENVVAVTCTVAGSQDSVVYCSVCQSELLRETKEIPAKGHTEVADAAVAATCTAAGKTEGKHCSVCHTVLVAQEVIPAGHKADSVVFENIVEATRTAAGSYDSVVYCSVCKVELSRTTVVVPQILAESIKLASKPNKVEYKQGEALDVKGGKITIGYTDKSTEDFEILAGWVSGFDSQKVGEQKLTVTFESVSSTLTTTFNVTVSKEDDNTAIDEDAANAVNIYAYQNVIVVENADAEIYVYDAMGRLVERNLGNNSRTEIRMNNAGVYIVKVGNTAKRVMVK